MNLTKLLEQKTDPAFRKRLRDISFYSEKWNLKPYLVGGIVRDLFLSKTPKMDCDVTVSGGDTHLLATTLSRHWKAEHTQHPTFLTHTFKFLDGSTLDLVTAREERYPRPAALPVVKKGSLLSDLLRRDFSINAMALSLNEENWGELVDPLGGLLNLKHKQIKILHPRSFEDDPTRIFRVARFLCRFLLELEGETRKALGEAVRRKMILKLSGDRVRGEIEKIIEEKEPMRVFAQLGEWGVLEQINPGADWIPAFAGMTTGKGMTSGLTGKERVGFYLSYLLIKNKIVKVKTLLDFLHFDREIQEMVLGNLELVEVFTRGEWGNRRNWGQSIEKNWGQSLKGQSPILFRFFDDFIRSKEGGRFKNSWHRYQKWCKSVPLLDGEGLKRLGWIPGPVFKEIFHKIQMEKFMGRLKNIKDEIKFVVDNFRRD